MEIFSNTNIGIFIVFIMGLLAGSFVSFVWIKIKKPYGDEWFKKHLGKLYDEILALRKEKNDLQLIINTDEEAMREMIKWREIKKEELRLIRLENEKLFIELDALKARLAGTGIEV